MPSWQTFPPTDHQTDPLLERWPLASGVEKILVTRVAEIISKFFSLFLKLLCCRDPGHKATVKKRKWRLSYSSFSHKTSLTPFVLLRLSVEWNLHNLVLPLILIGSRMIRDQYEKNSNKWSLPCGHTQLISVNADPCFRQFFAVLQSSRWFFEVMSKFASSPAAILLIPN